MRRYAAEAIGTFAIVFAGAKPRNREAEAEKARQRAAKRFGAAGADAAAAD